MPEKHKAVLSGALTGMDTSPMTDIWLMMGRQACGRQTERQTGRVFRMT